MPTVPVQTPLNTIALDANVYAVINAIDTSQVIPFGDYGSPFLYYFNTDLKHVGNLVYTIFDRQTTLGLESYAVRFGAATTIREAIFGQWPKSQIDLRYLILPNVSIQIPTNGQVLP